eukprot:SAG31_NODE_6406_length_2031_cov_1.235507_2_plen_168_part_00
MQAILFLLEIDNQCYAHGLSEQVRARVENKGRLRLVARDLETMNVSKNVHIGLIMFGIPAVLLALRSCGSHDLEGEKVLAHGDGTVHDKGGTAGCWEGAKRLSVPLQPIFLVGGIANAVASNLPVGPKDCAVASLLVFVKWLAGAILSMIIYFNIRAVQSGVQLEGH